MTKINLKILILPIAIIIASCSKNSSKNNTDKPIVVATIAPIKGLLNEIADSTIEISVLVPETTSPETYEPTLQQLQSLNSASIVASIGLIDFERELENNIRNIAKSSASYIDLSSGMEIMAGTCSHGHHHGHKHGIDPHTWLSPKNLKLMAKSLATELALKFPENAEKYATNLEILNLKLDSLDRSIQSTLESKETRKFVIAHPSLSYYAKDYNLEQISIEHEGKEPSTRHLKNLIDNINDDKITIILYQKQLSGEAAQVLSKHTAAKCIEFDPLDQNVIANIQNITDTLDVYLH